MCQLLGRCIGVTLVDSFALTTSVKGTVLELAFVWHVLRTVVLNNGAASLKEVLAPLLADKFGGDAPSAVEDLVVVASVGLSQFRVTPDEDAYVPTALAALPSGGLVVRERCQSSGRFQVFKSLQLRFAWIGLAVLIGLEAS